MTEQTRAQQRRAVVEGLYEKLAGSLEHEGDTAGFYTLPEDYAVPLIESALLAAEVEQRRRDAAIARRWQQTGEIAEAIEADGEKGD